MLPREPVHVIGREKKRCSLNTPTSLGLHALMRQKKIRASPPKEVNYKQNPPTLGIILCVLPLQ